MTQLQKLLAGLQERAKTALKDEKKRMNLLLVTGLAGMVLLAVSEWLPDKAPATHPVQEQTQVQSAAPQDCAALEQRLQHIISQVEGAGETEVMVTLQKGERTVYATDTERTADGGESQQHILLGSGDSALVESVETPTLLGVAVVCEGGGDAGVQSRVTAVVQAVTDLGSNHITVTKMTARNTGEGQA